MARRPPIARRLLAALLSVALAAMATASGASWQCLDGRPCPPGCEMTRLAAGTASATRGVPPCCRSHGSSCPLCAGAHRASGPDGATHCTSSVCVLRFADRPNAALTHAATVQVIDAPAALPPLPAVVAVRENTSSFGTQPPRGPPRHAAASHSTPRAPPSLP